MIPSHAFRVGEQVRYFAACDVLNTRGEFIIVRLLPVEQEGPQYQIRSRTDGHLRRALERELVRLHARRAAIAVPPAPDHGGFVPRLVGGVTPGREEAGIGRGQEP